MTDILYNWINKEVKLSKQITNIKDDFSNGYFFGELLNKYKLLPQFNQFKNDSEKTSITKNYLLLQYKLSELKISFTEQEKKDIINKKKYKAEMLLFRIREKLLSKLLQIEEIETQAKKNKTMNKIYTNVIKGITPPQRIQSAVPKKSEKMKLDNKYNTIISSTRLTQNQITKRERLQSAKLPKLNKNVIKIGKNRAYISGIESIAYNNILSNQENTIFKQTLKEIEIFENIHMRNKIDIEKLEKRKHQKEENKEKRNLESWKKNYKIYKQFNEEKKEKDNQKINRLKSATQRAFNQTQKNCFDNIDIFDKKLEHLGLNTKIENMETKMNEISTEAYMKSIIDAVKEKEKMRRQFNNRMKRLRGIEESNEIKEDNKEFSNDDFLLEQNKKRPQSSATTFMFFNNKNKSNKTNTLISNSPKSKNRPITARINMHSNKNNIIKNKIRPKSGFYTTPINKIEDKTINKTDEFGTLTNINKEYLFNEYTNFDEKNFFDDLDKENFNFFKMKTEKRHKEILYNRKIIKNIVNSLLDIVDLCFEYKNEHNKKLVEMDEWDKIISKFISGNLIITKKEAPKKINIEENLDNSEYNIYTPIKKEDENDFGEYEYDELQNFKFLIGNKFDPEKNNVLVNRFKLGQIKIDINNIMNPDEILLLYEEAKKTGKLVIDEDDDYQNNNQIRYIPNKEEEELLEPFMDKCPSNYIFTGLITESIKYSYDKDPNTFIPKDTWNSKVIEEEIINQQQNDTENSQNRNLAMNNDIYGVSQISEENKNEIAYKTSSKEVKNVNMKDLIESIPVRISFIGVQKTEKKTRAKNMINKYPGLKIYNIKELKKSLEENNKELNDENIIELLTGKIREDFQYKSLENVKKDIIKKREDIKNLNNEIDKLKEEQEKKAKFNIAKDVQNIQQQIDKIINDSLIGFILIGIPENITQLKLLEKKLMNFTQPCEQSISLYDSIYEKLTLICDQPQKENLSEKNYTLSLNKIIHFESNKEVIFKKIDNRKKDPVKGDIYQMDLFPPKDKKILLRLEDILNPTHEEIEQEIINDDINSELIEDYYTNLDTKCVKFKGYIINENLDKITNYNNYMQILEQNALELDNQIEKEILDTLNLYEEKLIGPINETIHLLDDIDNNTNINESSGANKDKKDDLSQIPEMSNNPISTVNNANNKTPQNQLSKKDSLNSSMTFAKEISRINSNNNINNTTQGDISTSQIYIFPSSSLSEVELFKTYQIWNKLVYSYTNQYYKIFNKEKKSGQQYIQRLNQLQKDFIEFLSQPSKKSILIDQFLNKYIEFSNKCKSMEKNQVARNRYLDDINELNETLWKTVEIRKIESLEKVKESSKIINQELNICYSTIEKMAILETQKFIEIINIILRFISKNKMFQLNSPNTQPYIFIIDEPSKEILRKCDTCELATYDPKKNRYNYPRANQIYKNCLRILVKLHYYLNKNVIKFHEKIISSHQNKNRSAKKIKFKKTKRIMTKQNPIKNNVLGNSTLIEVQNKLKLAIKIEIDKYKFIVYNLYKNSLESLSKIFCASKLVFKLMDNWIIDSMMYQNEAMQKLFNKLKSISIEQIISNNKILNKENIYENIELDDFKEKYKLFNFNEFLLDGVTDKRKYLSPNELNQKDFGNNIEIILKLFTNWGITNTNIENNFGEIINFIKNGEIQNGIITRRTFEKLFFINKVVENENKIFPDFFYNFDFHNFSLFLSHFISIIEDNNKQKEDKIENNDNEEEQRDKNEINIDNSNKLKDKKHQELINTNEILTILFLICLNVISDEEIEIMKKENENKLINGKYINKENFITIKFWFEEKFSKTFKNYPEVISKYKLFLYEINEKKNGFVHFIHFLDLISLKSLKFKNESDKTKIKNYFDLFLN